MKGYDKNIESSYLMYLDANDLWGWEISQKGPVNNFKWEKSVSKFDEDSNAGYILEVDIKYPRKLLNLHSDLPSLAEKLTIEKCNKLVCTLQDKKICCIHKNLKTSIKHRLILRKLHRVIQFNQKAWLKPYIEMNTKLKTETKNDFQKDFFQIK